MEEKREVWNTDIVGRGEVFVLNVGWLGCNCIFLFHCSLALFSLFNTSPSEGVLRNIDRHALIWE